jgi:acyl-CoA dehydrogenase
MTDRTYLDWPFFEPRHRSVAAEAEIWAAEHAEILAEEADPDACLLYTF